MIPRPRLPAKASLVTSQIVRGTHSCTSDDPPPLHTSSPHTFWDRPSTPIKPSSMNRGGELCPWNMNSV